MPLNTMNEKWEYWEEGGRRFARVTGREKLPDELKKDWRWWLKNDYQQTVDEAPWYHPEWPQDKRVLYWNYFRNPLQNWRAFVIGVSDRNYTVEVLEGNPDPMVVQRNDVGELGYQRTRLFDFEDNPSEVKLFTSYCGPRVVWYHGWQPSGFYGFKFNLSS